MIPLIFFVCLTTCSAVSTTDSQQNETTTESATTTKEILKASETGDPTKLEIVKQIRRLNDDGSYTIGYEANDGTFKIESRDVRGNVKGTFGYVDEDGEIKRVTYSSNGESTPIPVSTTSTMSTPMMVVRVNKTVSTTRRPTTIVYPTRSSATTRGTVIQAIPRRRPVSSSTRATSSDPITETDRIDETTTNSLFNLKEERVKTRTQLSKPISATITNDLIAKSTTSKPPQTVKPVYEEVTEKELDVTKTNGIRRQLSGTNYNHHMVNLQQSMGDDSTDVYGGHMSHGTVRPLFTTTPRSRLLPVHSLINSRQRSQQYQDIQHNEETAETSTGRIYDQQNIVTSSPRQVVHIPDHREQERYYNQPIYQRPPAAVNFRTDEYLRDNPGAPIPIGNQRPFLQYEYQDKVLDSQVLKDQQKVHDHVQYDVRPVTRVIPVDDRGVPIQGYKTRYVNSYRPPLQRYDPYEEMQSITAPVSTRDFRRLLQILILRQNRLQSLMDQLMPTPYHPNQPYRREEYQPRYYQEEDRYEYRREPQYRQRDEVYSNQNYDQYESNRYVPRRRSYRPYDSITSATNNIDEPDEYLPVEVREALLLKMLILAISPDYMPTPAPATELTTAAPTRKQVRNVQILGEEPTTNTAKP
ncbi:uncharacterized protein LOC126967971 [Leptidea sinapis]|uniref:uncharacterized protein LOC126967971 n=1 Tax=Leptidea sinapis TaxID=189913 RepID=UPI002145B6A1|nr:uncharacterized protein LOC126967971 [Leptidea sinapis]